MTDFAPLSTARRWALGSGDKPPASLGRFELKKQLGRGAQATVCLEWEADGLTVQVNDNGAGLVPELSPGLSSGAGLIGLRHRVAELGGTFQYGRRPEGGFAVTARLPITSAESSSAAPASPLKRLSKALGSMATFGL